MMQSLSKSFLVLLLALSLAACSDDASRDETPDAGPSADASEPDANPACANSTLTYANFGQQFFIDYCLRCHSETAVNRRGAPANVNFDRFDLVKEQKDRIKARAGTGLTMPPRLNPQPSAEERASLVEWIDCGLVN